MTTQKKNSAVKAVSFMMLITLVGKVLGLVRDQLLAANYGNGMAAEAFTAAERSGTCYGSGKSGLTLRPYEFAWGSGNQPASSAGAPGRPPPSVQKGKVVRFAFRFAAVRKEMV